MEQAVYRRMADLEREHWWFVARRRILQTLLECTGGGPGRVLEVGSGTGGNLIWLRRFGPVTALEPEPLARALCAETTGVAAVAGALPGPLPLARAQFRLICALDVLEHIDDDHAALVALRDLLQSDGRLLLTVPAAPWLWSDHDRRHHHRRRYRYRQITQLLRTCGYRLEYASYYNCWLLPLIALVRAWQGQRGEEVGPEERLPPPWLNRLLGALFASERHLLGRWRLPVGASLVVLARRGGESGD